jgi:hypothetical protein
MPRSLTPVRQPRPGLDSSAVPSQTVFSLTHNLRNADCQLQSKIDAPYWACERRSPHRFRHRPDAQLPSCTAPQARRRPTAATPCRAVPPRTCPPAQPARRRRSTWRHARVRCVPLRHRNVQGLGRCRRANRSRGRPVAGRRGVCVGVRERAGRGGRGLGRAAEADMRKWRCGRGVEGTGRTLEAGEQQRHTGREV